MVDVPDVAGELRLLFFDLLEQGHDARRVTKIMAMHVMEYFFTFCDPIDTDNFKIELEEFSKMYGNKTEEERRAWMKSMAEEVGRYLAQREAARKS